MKIQLPSVHLNGSSIDDLIAGYDKAAETLHDFMEAFGEIEFNARDYYVEGPHAWEQALDARHKINSKIREVSEYIQAHREHLHHP